MFVHHDLKILPLLTIYNSIIIIVDSHHRSTVINMNEINVIDQ